ncbi:MAG: hypothetical protein WC607_04695 [Candidatus Micrarchaeia archaeon]
MPAPERIEERPSLTKLYREARASPDGLRPLNEFVKANPEHPRANLYLAKAIQWWHSANRTGEFPMHPKARFFFERYKQLTEELKK